MKQSFSRGYFDFPSKHQGAMLWLLERLTGVVLILLSGWFLYHLFFRLSGDFDATLAWILCPWNTCLLVLLMGFILFHSYLGVEVVIDDYVHISFWYSAAMFILKTIMAVTACILAISFYHIIF